MGTTEAMDASIEQARLGVLYLFGSLRCTETSLKTICNGLLDLSDAGTAFYRGNIRPVDPRNRQFNIGGRPVEVNRQAAQDKLQDTFTWAVRQVVEYVDAASSGTTTSGDSRSLFTMAWLYLRDYVSEMVKGLMRKAADGLFSGIPSWAEAVSHALKSGVEAYRLHIQGKTVAVRAGVPSAVVEGITLGLTRTTLGQVYQAVKATVGLGLKATIGLAQGIVDLVASFVEIIVNAVWKIYEVLRFNQFCSEARLHWEQRGSALPWHVNARDFHAWYLLAVRRVPCIAAITLKSGICGDSMQFLRMIGDAGQVISHAEYAKGMSYMGNLKAAGDKYLANIGYAFDSQHLDIRALITMNGKPFRMSAEMEKEALKILRQERLSP